ncbi:MAG: amino acid decarboxylase, partial [Clostridia bacterium]|nr:amino acid decarboxylase [Clostridia bacterium]
MNTPICDFVKAYDESRPLRLHMPGHKGVSRLGCEGLDITEIEGADVLYRSSGIIRESEENAAALFGTARTVYSTEGSSLCIRAMLYLAMQHTGRRRILAGRNAHATFVTAAALLDAQVQWLFAAGGGLTACPLTAEGLSAALDTLPEKPAAVYVTSPDYLGNTLDIAALARVCHDHDTLL